MTKQALSLCITAFLCLAAAAWAAPAPLGSPFRVSDCPDCTQSEPAVAGTPAGRFLVVWEGENPADPRGLLGRLFTPSGVPRTRDFLVNRVTQPQQYDAAVAADARGGFLVAWSQINGGSDGDILVQRLRPLGARLGEPIQVNVDDPSDPANDFNPVVAAAPDGGFVVVWISLFPPGSVRVGPPAVLARRFDAAGVPRGPQVRLNQGLVSGDRPDVCVDSAGRLVAVWTSVDAFRPFEPSLQGVSARRLTAAGTALGGEIVVAPPLAGDAPAAVSCGLAGTFVVVWESDQPPVAERSDVLAQRFSTRGRRLGPVFRVNSQTQEGQGGNPAVSHDSAGNFVVVWESDQGAGGQIVGRSFAGNGAPAGPDFLVDVNSSGLRPAEPDVAHFGRAGNFVVVWRDGVAGLFGRRFRP